MNKFFPVWCAVHALAALGHAGDGPRIEDYAYPFPVTTFAFTSQQQALEMAHMDVAAAQPDAEVVLLLHGKNFSGAFWDATARALHEAGYRVVMPDQIGFGKSSKPAHYQFSFHQLAANTRALLASLGITRTHVVGHSMGGMLATRYALLFPEATTSLTLINPLGLEDWQAKGVPHRTIDAAYQRELQQTPERVRAYQRDSYYHGEWRPEYERGVEYAARFIRDPEYARMAWNQALTYDMIFTQPVCYEFPRLRGPVLVLIGQLDRTAIGKDAAPEAIRGSLGDYRELGRRAAQEIPGSKLVALEGLGHTPQVEAPEVTHRELLQFLRGVRAAPRSQ